MLRATSVRVGRWGIAAVRGASGEAVEALTQVDEEVLLSMKKQPEELAKDMRLAAAAKWYEVGLISQERAAQVAGMSRAEFIFSLAHFGVSAFQETAQEVVQALEGQ